MSIPFKVVPRDGVPFVVKLEGADLLASMAASGQAGIDATLALANGVLDETKTVRDEAVEASEFLDTIYDRYNIPGYLMIEADEAGHLVRTLKSDGEHRMVQPLTRDSVLYQGTASIGGVSRVALNGEGKVLWYERSTGGIVDFRVSAAAGGDDGAAETGYGDASRYRANENQMWSKWVYPLAIETADDTLVATSLARADLTGPYAPLWLSTSLNFDSATRVSLGRVESAATGRTDDHNEPGVAYDPTPGSPVVWQATQSDHARRSYSRNWTAADPRGPWTARANIASSGTCTYGQLFIKPDNSAIRWLLLRHEAGSEFGRWSIFTSSDHGITWTPRPTMFADDGLYVAGRPTLAGDGIWLQFVPHPINSPDRRLKLAKLKWTGELVAPSPGGEVVIRANLFDDGAAIRPATDNPPFVIVANAAPQLASSFDAGMWEFAGGVHLTWAQFDATGQSDTSGSYYRAVVNPITGEVATTQIVACGGKIETRSTASYVGGICTVSETETVCARYWPNEGYSDLLLMRFDGTAWQQAAVIDRTVGGKIARPIVAVRTEWDAPASRIIFSLSKRLRYLRMSGKDAGYTDFYTYNSAGIDFDLHNVGVI